MYGQYSRAGYSYSSDDYAIWTGKKKFKFHNVLHGSYMNMQYKPALKSEMSLENLKVKRFLEPS